MKLLVAIPALDEEESIRAIVERTLAAREVICAESPVTAVDVTVVSDGSTDRTAEIAREYSDRIELIEFPENQGYGAAILAAWNRSDAELLGFLDADGTCDPAFFAPLCRTLDERGADVVLGCRLHARSRMPFVRRLGNRLFALMLTLFSSEHVRDVASGMRVVRREVLPRLLPLPVTLDFTPAMSARALLSGSIVIAEIDMPYEEREGRSKLSPLRDGVRFLATIVRTALLYRPSRPLGLCALVLFACATAMMVGPALHYASQRALEEWMIYRFLVAQLFGIVGALLFTAGHLGRKAADISLSEHPAEVKHGGLLGRVFASRWFWLAPVLLIALGGALVGDAWVEYVTTGHVDEHWSRFVVMTFLLCLTAVLVVAKVLDYSLNLLADRLEFTRDARHGESLNERSREA